MTNKTIITIINWVIVFRHGKRSMRQRKRLRISCKRDREIKKRSNRKWNDLDKKRRKNNLGRLRIGH